MEQATRQLKLEVAYARADQQVLAEVQVPEGATVREAIEASRVLARFPEIDLEKSKVGVYGKVVPLDTVVKSGDRVEIYRPRPITTYAIPEAVPRRDCRRRLKENSAPNPNKASPEGSGTVRA